MAVKKDDSTDKTVAGTDDPKVLGSATETPNGEPIMQLKVYSPFQTYFNEPAYSITASNDTGPFDILPQHHKFITLLNECELDIKAPQGERKIRISGGIMHVKENNVAVFLDV